MLKQVFIPVLLVIFLNGGAANAQFVEEAGGLGSSTMWVGKNGVGFRGAFIDRKGDVLRVGKDSNGRVYEININNLHRNKKEWFLKEWEKREARKILETGKESKITAKAVKLSPGVVVDLDRTPVVDTTGYKLVDEKKADRSIVPNFNQADYGSKSSDCVPNSYAMFVTWWHLRNWVKVPEKREFEDTVDWIHKRLARSMKTRNNSGTSSRRIAEYLSSFFSNDVKTKAAFTVQVVMDFRPENLSKYVRDGNCTVLLLSVYHGRKYSAGHAVALKRLDADGTVEFNTWGMKLKGKLKLIPDSEEETRISTWTTEGRRKTEKIKLPQYEIELINRVDLPEWFINDERRFVLEAGKLDNLVVLTPYLPVKADAGVRN